MNAEEERSFSLEYDREMRNMKSCCTVDPTVKDESQIRAKTELQVLFQRVRQEFQNVIQRFANRTVRFWIVLILLVDSKGNHETIHQKKYIKNATLQRRTFPRPFERSRLVVLSPGDVPSASIESSLTKTANETKQIDGVGLSGLSTKLFQPASLSRSPRVHSLEELNLPKEILVECCGVPGIFFFGEQKVRCECAECLEKPDESRILTATHFEQHCGAGSAKKWKASVRIRPGAVSEVAPGDPPLPLGRWFVMKGIDEYVTRVPVSSRKRDPNKTPKRQLYAHSGFEGLGRAQTSDSNPWDQVRVGGYMKIHVRIIPQFLLCEKRF